MLQNNDNKSRVALFLKTIYYNICYITAFLPTLTSHFERIGERMKKHVKIRYLQILVPKS